VVSAAAWAIRIDLGFSRDADGEVMTTPASGNTDAATSVAL
jgi:hypothetical protein